MEAPGKPENSSAGSKRFERLKAWLRRLIIRRADGGWLFGLRFPWD